MADGNDAHCRPVDMIVEWFDVSRPTPDHRWDVSPSRQPGMINLRVGRECVRLRSGDALNLAMTIIEACGG